MSDPKLPNSTPTNPESHRSVFGKILKRLQSLSGSCKRSMRSLLKTNYMRQMQNLPHRLQRLQDILKELQAIQAPEDRSNIPVTSTTSSEEILEENEGFVLSKIKTKQHSLDLPSYKVTGEQFVRRSELLSQMKDLLPSFILDLKKVFSVLWKLPLSGYKMETIGTAKTELETISDNHNKLLYDTSDQYADSYGVTSIKDKSALITGYSSIVEDLADIVDQLALLEILYTEEGQPCMVFEKPLSLE